MKRTGLALIFVFILMFCFCSCIPDDMREISVYFLDKSGTSLQAESRSVPFDDTEAEAAVKELLAGPKSTEHIRAIPENTALISIGVSNKVATVNFSQDFEKTATAFEAVMARYSVVCTLCGIEGIQRVQILVNGRKLVSAADGTEIGELSRTDVILDDDIGRNQTAVINLYFANKNTKGLVAEKRVVEIQDNETIEKTIMTELLKGPDEKENIRAVPADSKLLHIETKDGVCYVNLSKEFMDKQSTDAEAMRLSVYSIVNSLTEERQVSSVQFLIDGEKIDAVGDLMFTEAFFRNENLIVQTESE